MTNADTLAAEMALLCILILFGFRLADLQGMERKLFDLTSHRIDCEVRISKSRGQRRDRTRLIFPVEWLPEDTVEMYEELRTFMDGFSTHSVVFRGITVDQINDRLRTYSEEFSLPNRPTTYSFRRCYIQHFARRFTDASGHVELDKLARYTLHLEPETLGAYYLQLLSDTAPPVPV
mgnify:FL=1